MQQVYGMSEQCGVVSVLGPADHGDPAVAHRMISAGKAIAGVEIEIRDPMTGQPLPVGEPGEIWVRSEQVMGGYWGKPEATAAAITPGGWLRCCPRRWPTRSGETFRNIAWSLDSTRARFGTMPSMRAPLYKVPLKAGAPKAGRAGTVYQLRIELRGVKPKVWRRIVVSGSLTLAKLHRVIQAAMGWSDSHLHEFVIDQQRYGQNDPEWNAPGEVISEGKATVSAALLGCGSARYIYDFGDYWEHDIKVEPTPAQQLDLKTPVCIAGKNACPPEDCGGPPGYADFLRAVTDPNHPEHDETIEWAGRPWDHTAFSIDGANQDIKRIR